MFKLLGGIIMVIVGVCFLIYNIIETRRGYRSDYGNDIGLYSGSIMFIMIGIMLIYQATA